MATNNELSARCVGCGDRIPPERLEVLPDTRHCVNCSDVRAKDEGDLEPLNDGDDLRAQCQQQENY